MAFSQVRAQLQPAPEDVTEEARKPAAGVHAASVGFKASLLLLLAVQNVRTTRPTVPSDRASTAVSASTV
jgi:hypothetical protein